MSNTYSKSDQSGKPSNSRTHQEHTQQRVQREQGQGFRKHDQAESKANENELKAFKIGEGSGAFDDSNSNTSGSSSRAQVAHPERGGGTVRHRLHLPPQQPSLTPQEINKATKEVADGKRAAASMGNATFQVVQVDDYGPSSSGGNTQEPKERLCNACRQWKSGAIYHISPFLCEDCRNNKGLKSKV